MSGRHGLVCHNVQCDEYCSICCTDIILNAGMFECYFTLVQYVPGPLDVSRILRFRAIHVVFLSGPRVQKTTTFHHMVPALLDSTHCFLVFHEEKV